MSKEIYQEPLVSRYTSREMQKLFSEQTRIRTWRQCWIALAEAQEMVGNMPAAAEAYQQAVQFNPQWRGSQADAATTFFEAGQWEDALETYHQIIGN